MTPSEKSATQAAIDHTLEQASLEGFQQGLDVARSIVKNLSQGQDTECQRVRREWAIKAIAEAEKLMGVEE